MSKQLNILLVEDDEVDVMNLKRAFQKNNIQHRLFVAYNGEDALYLLRFTDIPKPHVILLDINMPKMNGLELLHILRNDPYYKDVSIYILTSSNEEIDRHKAFDLNVSGYMLKPLSSNDFVTQISVLNNFWQHSEFPH